MIEFQNFKLQWNDHLLFSIPKLTLSQKRYLLLSPTGAGKTCFLKTIAHLIPSEGVKTSSPIAMCFQQNALFDSLNVEENLSFIAETLNLDHSFIPKVLQSVGLFDHRQKNPNDLSGGMRKRLGIARTLLLNRPIELYDDPTAGLDPVTAKQILSLIEELTRNKLVIIASHEIHAILPWVDEVLLLENETISAVSKNQTERIKAYL